MPWGRQGAPEDPRVRIVEAASRCLAKYGLDRTSLAVIAREAGVSRQTIYKYFPTKDDIVAQALEKEASEASERLMAVASANSNAEDFVVDLCLSAIEEFGRNPAISPVISVLEHADARGRLLTPEVIAIARHYLEPILDYRPDRAQYLDEMTETYLRILLSLLTIEGPSSASPDSLRAYLRRVLVPALGLGATSPS
ncbi:TetR/AcrR family transcriptional regulator [Aldersonia kunmingensis]|uniref:TetR/AcrR family transcriptional regulator n=1 Tax=Aldersonia kunmingensis TaxID=408066 RepID=UPI002480F780|nr:TetR/AcrR family transcriptional regulator [Aldersonia kunmingensis]